MDVPIFEQLQREGLVSNEALEHIKSHEQSKSVSVHWDLRALLYFSILLISSGLGIVLYKHADSIGHATLLTLTGALAVLCFFYCFKKCAPYSHLPVAVPNVWFDYVLLLGCLLMLAFVGYLQYQYHVFGMRWGLATFIPMLFLFFSAYYFDHKGVLSLAIVNLGAWMGIAVEPLRLMRRTDLSDENIIINGVVLGLLLHLFELLSARLKIKPHFATVYKNFSVHVLFISLIAGTAHFDGWYFLWFFALMGVAAYHLKQAFAESSFYFLVVTVLYGYYGISYVVVRLLSKLGYAHQLAAYCIVLYFIASGIGLVIVLMRLNKQLKVK